MAEGESGRGGTGDGTGAAGERRRRPRRRIQVELIGDLACPWCYLGLVRLERARAARPGLPVRLAWRPFLLDPHLPADGVDARAYLRWKFGGEEAAARVHARIARSGRADGVAFAFERMARSPNTVAAHRLVLAAERAGRGAAALHGLFRGLFVEGRDLGRAGELRAIGRAAGLDAATVAGALEGEAGALAVLRSDRALRGMGVTGVPVFVFQARHAVSGAQPPEVLTGLLDLAAVTAGLRDPVPVVAAAAARESGPAAAARRPGAAPAAGRRGQGRQASYSPPGASGRPPRSVRRSDPGG